MNGKHTANFKNLYEKGNNIACLLRASEILLISSGVEMVSESAITYVLDTFE